MGELSEFRLGAVRKLIEQAPDRAIRSLETVLASNGGSGSLALVSDMINAEKLERRLRATVFAPVAPHCDTEIGPLVGRLTFPAQTLQTAWRAVKALDPDLIDRAMRGATTLSPDDVFPPEFDEICLRVAQGLQDADAGFAQLAKVLGPSAPAFIDCLTLCPVVRAVLPKLPVWIRTLSNEPAAAIRVAFRDATTVKEDAGPAFMELLYGHLDEPWQVLRLISLVMDRPSDRYLAASELAGFGERLLAEADRRIESVKRFDASRGREAGVEAAASVQFAVTMIAEFEQWFAIARDGPWGQRLSAQKRNVALVSEARLREAEGAVNAALPLQTSQLVARTARGEPNLANAVNETALRKAQALLAFIYETRASAAYAGFASKRAKVLEALDPRIDHFADDLLDLLHEGEGDRERVRAFLDAAADLLGLVREPRASEILRRRAAVA